MTQSSLRLLTKPYLAFLIVILLCGLMISIMHFSRVECMDCSIEDKSLQYRDIEGIQGKAGNRRDLDTAMKRLSGEKTMWDDPELVHIAEGLIETPRPYVSKFSLPLWQTPQAKKVDELLQEKSGGFFVECGALDGERSSNSLWLENKRGWSGLLVEMDPSYYMQLRGKNRKSRSINACLSPQVYPVVMPFKEHAMGEGKLVEKGDENNKQIHNTYCFPLYTLMLAMNVTVIDYFSLDVEGMEVPILKTIPFDKLDIKVLSVEYIHGKGGQKEYVTFMESKGYKVESKVNYFYKAIYNGGNDFIFVKK